MVVAMASSTSPLLLSAEAFAFNGHPDATRVSRTSSSRGGAAQRLTSAALAAGSVHEQPDVDFVSQPSASLLCPVCHDVCRDPLITSGCSHSYCAACILQSLEVEPHCPLCRKRVDREDLHPNLALDGLISELPVYCTHKVYGCEAILRKDGLENHVNYYCGYFPASCLHKERGCDYKGTSKGLSLHLETCIFEKLRGFMDRNDERVKQLEETVEEQTKQLAQLRRLLNLTRSGLHLGDGPAADVSDADKASDEENDVSELAWPRGEIQCRKTISENACGVTSLAYHQGKLFAGAHDGSTKIFDAETGEMLTTLNGHCRSVWALAVHPPSGRLFSAGSDGLIKVWECHRHVAAEAGFLSAAPDELPNDGASPCVSPHTLHNGKVYGLLVCGDRLFSASSDGTVNIWDSVTLARLATLRGHSDGVNTLVALDDGRLATGSSDKTVKIWDVARGTCVSTINIGTSDVLDIDSGGGMIFASTHDALIHACSIDTLASVATMVGHNWEVWQLTYTSGVLFSGSFDHTIKRWDVRTFNNDATLVGHKGYVHAMALGDNSLITGCADRTIKIWR